MVRRLDFVLGDFTRVAWVSEAARQAWAWRLHRIMRAWQTIELASVGAGVRPCALVSLTPDAPDARDAIAASSDLSIRTLDDASASDATDAGSDRPAASGRPPNVLVAIGRAGDLTHLETAWTHDRADEVGALLGYPECCRRAFVARVGEDFWLDHTWPMSTAALDAAPPSAAEVSAIDLPLSALNMLWRVVGVRPVPHLPCRCDCPASLRLRDHLFDVARSAGLHRELRWLDDVLSWPVEWSALHGIAEIKTPILKIAARSDATAEKIVVRWRGERYPDEGARGIVFPYRASARQRSSESAGRRQDPPAVIPLQPV